MCNHLTRTDRALIEKYLAQGYNLSEIANFLSRHVSTIAREIKNNRKFLINEFYSILKTMTGHFLGKTMTRMICMQEDQRIVLILTINLLRMGSGVFLNS